MDRCKWFILQEARENIRPNSLAAEFLNSYLDEVGNKLMQPVKTLHTSEYDNESFFNEYAKMARSQGGLPAAGEWHQLKPLFPPLQGKRVLDLGYGWHCKFAEAQCGRSDSIPTLQYRGLRIPRKCVGLLNNGFELQAVEEAQPTVEMLRIPGMKDELRRPMMLLVKAAIPKKL